MLYQEYVYNNYILSWLYTRLRQQQKMAKRPGTTDDLGMFKDILIFSLSTTFYIAIFKPYDFCMNYIIHLSFFNIPYILKMQQATLENLTVETLLSELKVRYREDNVYTYVGEIVCAVNPFKMIPGRV